MTLIQLLKKLWNHPSAKAFFAGVVLGFLVHLAFMPRGNTPFEAPAQVSVVQEHSPINERVALPQQDSPPSVKPQGAGLQQTIPSVPQTSEVREFPSRAVFHKQLLDLQAAYSTGDAAAKAQLKSAALEQIKRAEKAGSELAADPEIARIIADLKKKVGAE